VPEGITAGALLATIRISGGAVTLSRGGKPYRDQRVLDATKVSIGTSPAPGPA
jgi:hypothetical protein